MSSTGLPGFACLSCLSALLAFGCDGAAGKRDVSVLPDEITDDTKADSLNGPRVGGTIKVGQPADGDYTDTRGWIGYELELTAGPVEFDLSADDQGGAVLDTVVYVIGPRNEETRRYKHDVLDLNDDAAADDLHSHLSAEIPETGVYRVVVSTYDNYFTFPDNVSRGRYQLGAACPRTGFGVCGPALSPAGGACFADSDCVAGHLCDGAITCAPGTECLWVREGACVSQ